MRDANRPVRVAFFGLLVVALAVTSCQPSRPPEITADPELLPEIRPQHHVRIQASAEQLETIEDLWGQDITILDLLSRVHPEFVGELPDSLLGATNEVLWPSDDIDWDIPVTGGYAVVSQALTTAGNGDRDEPPSTPTVTELYFYIGKEAMEVMPRYFPEATRRETDYRAISIYTGP